MSDWISTKPRTEAVTLQWLKHEDQRARLMLDLVRSWSATHIIAEAMTQAHSEQPHQKVERASIDKIVFLAADMAEAAYDEIMRRGWQITIPEETP